LTFSHSYDYESSLSANSKEATYIAGFIVPLLVNEERDRREKSRLDKEN
jgi:hypothetical protein